MSMTFDCIDLYKKNITVSDVSQFFNNTKQYCVKKIKNINRSILYIIMNWKENIHNYDKYFLYKKKTKS